MQHLRLMQTLYPRRNPHLQVSVMLPLALGDELTFFPSNTRLARGKHRSG